MNAKLELNAVTDLVVVCNHYYELSNYYNQESGEALNINYTKWTAVDVHMVSQYWGNTSGGWEGIGGAAIISAYTVIIENEALKRAFIYYGNKLAYVCVIDKKYNAFKCKLDHLPGYTKCDNVLTITYKTTLY